MQCSRCPAPLEASVGLDFGLCQMCWEAECAELFWEQTMWSRDEAEEP